MLLVLVQTLVDQGQAEPLGVGCEVTQRREEGRDGTLSLRRFSGNDIRHKDYIDGGQNWSGFKVPRRILVIFVTLEPLSTRIFSCLILAGHSLSAPLSLCISVMSNIKHSLQNWKVGRYGGWDWNVITTL